MNVRFLQIAKTELDEAVAYYNHEKPALGYEFVWEIFFAIERIKQFPDAWPPFHEGTRRCLIRRFPYGIIYLREGDSIVIFAIAHLHRQPDYWIDRLSSENP